MRSFLPAFFSVTLALTGPLGAKPESLSAANIQLKAQFADLSAELNELKGSNDEKTIEAIGVTMNQVQQTMNYAAVGSRFDSRKRNNYATTQDVTDLLSYVSNAVNELFATQNPSLSFDKANWGNGMQRPLASITALTSAEASPRITSQMFALAGQITGQSGLMGLACLCNDIAKSSNSFSTAQFDTAQIVGDESNCPNPLPDYVEPAVNKTLGAVKMMVKLPIVAAKDSSEATMETVAVLAMKSSA